MRTTLDLDDQLLTALMARHPDLSKTQAVERALRAYLQWDAISELRELAGKLDIEDASHELRRRDRTT